MNKHEAYYILQTTLIIINEKSREVCYTLYIIIRNPGKTVQICRYQWFVFKLSRIIRPHMGHENGQGNIMF